MGETTVVVFSCLATLMLVFTIWNIVIGDAFWATIGGIAFVLNLTALRDNLLQR